MGKGKGKTLNPADAFRKAQRKKEIKKNKEVRDKTREIITVKKSTGGLEAEIKRLEESGTSIYTFLARPYSFGVSIAADRKGELDKNQKAKLTELRAEVQRIKKAKSDYVAAHPEHRKYVYGEASGSNTGKGNNDDDGKSLFGKNGLPRHPERSIYYDPTLNPYGMPPPGMPYIERPLEPHEQPQQPEATQEDDSDSDDSDEEMTEDAQPSDQAAPAAPNPIPSSLPPLPPGAPAPPIGHQQPVYPVNHALPPFPQGVPLPPPPPFGFPPQHVFHPLPPPPGGPPPRGRPAAIQDPLSSQPHTTFQEHQAMRRQQAQQAPLQHPLPANPMISARATVFAPPVLAAPAPAPAHEATIVAAPQLRDFKKESTAFVPAALRRKKAAPAAKAPARVNAAPESGPSTEEGPSEPKRPDLMATLGAAGLPGMKAKAKPVEKPKADEYEKFLAEIGDLIN
ncbi:hypothetical protein BOTBODRAFT_143852 [Botryobasidium botryosum FD-172 SS1]|uniref:Wbp11/ELF5/Saf1 N-terminal domain-containing protein n=1 Tax=Botryobasidium botryosum (strain FD-172 SS1) TaxID=930990 RepID=A0A067MRK3_BOTB1|nr:hypothetical protein BOTBODRAFT_143852 [Botryobasidium botryosum FD-172 SS1]